ILVAVPATAHRDPLPRGQRRPDRPDHLVGVADHVNHVRVADEALVDAADQVAVPGIGRTHVQRGRVGEHLGGRRPSPYLLETEPARDGPGSRRPTDHPPPGQQPGHNIPPFTWMVWPVTQPASGPARNATTLATSAGAPSRPSGV